jgi:1-deoxy-D-xylulose 5-phosphate reductoisomerase
VILNAANEEAFKLFSVGKIKYLQIIEIIKYSISKFTPVKVENISQIYAIDNNVRKFIKSVYN